MNGPSVSGQTPLSQPSDNDRLDSWKEIATYLRRDESTVRRWGKQGLPVHRHLHKSRAAVYAYKKELDAWWNQGRPNANLSDSAPPAGMVAEPGPNRRHLWLIATALGMTLLAVTAARMVLFVGHTGSATPPLALIAFMNMGGDLSYPSFSPDGKQIAFSWENAQLGGTQIFVKLVGSETPLQLTFDKGSDDFAATWSPDGREIAFLRQSAGETGIFVVSALGGPERKLKALQPDRYYALDWSPDGKFIAFSQRASVNDPYCVFFLPADGGEPRQVTFPPAQTGGDVRFAFSPDGKYLVLLRHQGPPKDLSVQLMPSSGGAPKILYEQSEWIGSLAWAADSQSLVLTGNRDGIRRLWRVYLPDGRDELLSDMGENAYYPSVARQGSRIAFVRETRDSDLWRTDLASPYEAGSPPTHVLSSTRVEGAPRFSPDGKRIAFESLRSGHGEIWTSDPDGSNAVQLTFLRTSDPQMPTWSPDGETIAFGDGGLNHLVSTKGGPPRRLPANFQGFSGPSWSRDGKWIYYWKAERNEKTQVWKVGVEDGRTIQVTKNGGFSSMESPDGKFLYFTRRFEPGLWKMPVNGREETLVMKGMNPTLQGYWAAFEDGVYYVSADAASQPTIQFYNFNTRHSTRILTMSGQPDAWFGGLTVSPDRKSIVFSQQQYQSTEIILGENFR